MSTTKLIQPTEIPVEQRIYFLNENDRALLTEILSKWHQIHDALRRTAECGIDVESRMEHHQAAGHMAKMLIEHHTPPSPLPTEST